MMKVRFQDALRNPTGWQECEASEWASLSKRQIPDLRERGGLDNAPGWVRNVSVQGVTTEGYDHVAIAPYLIGLDEGVRMVVWNDDADDLGPGERVAIVATILPLAPDPALGMAINTRQSFIRYAEGDRYERLLLSPPQNTTIRPWAEFERPPEALTRHGVWLADAKWLEHVERAPQSEFGWQHWCDHLPDSECEIDARGRRCLKEQRAQGRYHQAAHTITYYQRDTDRAAGWRVCTHEDALEGATAASATESVTTNAGAVEAWLFSTPADQPNSAAWPTGTYGNQLNCTAASVGLIYGTVPGTNMFHRLASDLASSLESKAKIEPQASGTGLKLFTTGSISWTAGAAADRYGHLIGAEGDSHGDAITLTLNTSDSYADGPWVTGPEPYQRSIIRSQAVHRAAYR